MVWERTAEFLSICARQILGRGFFDILASEAAAEFSHSLTHDSHNRISYLHAIQIKEYVATTIYIASGLDSVHSGMFRPRADHIKTGVVMPLVFLALCRSTNSQV